VNAKIGSEKARQIAQDPRRLSTDNVLLSHCFKDLISKMPKSFKGKLWQAGNAPLSVFTWQLDWQQNFVDGWFPKISLSLNKNTRAHSHDEPNFGFAVFLWHTDWCHNREWFLHNRRIILDHFSKRSFRIVRNTKGTWHTQFDWHSPYLEAEGLKYVNSFPPFKLYESDYGKYDWERIISILHGELCTIGENVNQLRSKLPLR
jgi:hypothetical protein